MSRSRANGQITLNNLLDRNGHHPDEDGDEFDTIDDVRTDVLISIKQIVANALVGGSTLSQALDGAFEIADEDGAILMTISFFEGVNSNAKA